MVYFKILSQNISRSQLGEFKKGGNIAPLRLQVNHEKPNIIILTEVVESPQYTGLNVFSGYSMTQYSKNRTNNRTGGVAVFVKKSAFEKIDDSYRSSDTGHFTVSVYMCNGTKFLIAAIYGPSGPSDDEAFRIYTEFIHNIKELMQIYGTNLLIIGGDFNLNFDKKRPNKPRTVVLMKQFFNECDLIDADAMGCTPTWRRPHLPNSASRLDYILISRHISIKKFFIRWTRFDHAMICAEAEYFHTSIGQTILKDWSLSSETFQTQAYDVIRDTLLDHDLEKRYMSQAERCQYIDGRSIAEFEQELQLLESAEGITQAHIFVIILNKLQQLQKKVQNQLKFSRKEKLDKISKQLARLYAKIDSMDILHPDFQPLYEQIVDLKNQIRSDSDMVEMANRLRISHFYQSSSGKNVAASFYVCKENRRGGGIRKLVNDDGAEINDPIAILEQLTNSYTEKVGSSFNPSSTLNLFTDKYNVHLPNLDTEEFSFLDTEVTFDEVKEILQTVKKKSAPGPSGQGSALIKYIFKIMPYTFISAINQLIFVPGLIHDKSFSWMLDRNIVYIPKPNKEPNKVCNVRPLSLLETVYKIQTKVLTNRMSSALEVVLYDNQHGFQKARSIQTATLPVLEAIKDAEVTGKSLQLIAIDIQSAFDTISPNIIFEIMLTEGFPTIFVDAMANLTAKGTGKVALNGHKGKDFDIVSGSGQGNPPSAGNFNLGTDPLIRAVKNVINECSYRLDNGVTIPPIAYADDHLHSANFENAAQVNDVLQVYKDYEKISGLKISTSKTVILGINTPLELMEEIHRVTGIQVVDGFRYLGIEIRGTYTQSKEASFNAAYCKQNSKFNKIHMAYLDLFHKRQLITSVILPAFNHIFMAFGIDEKWCKKIDEGIIKLLWSHRTGGIVKQKRRLVAKRRLNASFQYGGLQISFSEQVATGLLLNMLKRIKTQVESLDVNILLVTDIMSREIFASMGISIVEVCNMAGPLIWQQAATRLGITVLGQMCKAMANFLKIHEKYKDTWLSMPVIGHSLCLPIYRFTIFDGIILSGHGIKYVAQIFGINDLTGMIDKKTDAQLQIPLNILNKCKSLRVQLAKQNLPVNVRPGEIIFKALQRVRWSTTYRNMHRDTVDNSMPGPPAYFTRQRDGIPVPNLKSFMSGYNKLFYLKLHSKTLENSFNILNRTIWTNLKTALSNRNEMDDNIDDTCHLCLHQENTMHLLFECEKYSQPLWDILEDAINLFENSIGNHQRIRLHAYNIMYNLNITGIKSLHNDQILYFIQEIKRNMIYRRFLRATNAIGILHYNRARITAHLSLTLKKTIYQKKLEGSPYSYLEDLQHTLIGTL